MTSSYDLDNKEPIVIFNIKNELYKYHLENNALEKIKGLNAHKEIKVLKISKDASLIAFITIDKELFVFNQIEKKYLLNAKILNLDASKIFFSDENEHLFIYNYEGIEIYNLKLKKSIMYIQDPTVKLCYDLKLLDSLGVLVVIKNDLNTYYLNIKDNKELNIIKNNIDTALFIEYHIDKKEFITINSNKELCLYDKQFNFISKIPLAIDKNEAIKDFFLDSISNKIFIFGSKIWVFCYENFSLLNIIDTNIKNLQTSSFYSHKNYLALCYYDFSIDILNLNTGKKIKNIKGLSQTSVSLEKNTSYLYLYLFNDSKISKYSLKEMKVASFIDIKYSTITASCNSKNTLLALYNIEKNITLFDLIKNKIAKTIPINDKNTFCLALTQDASMLAYKDGNKLIFIDTIDYTILSMLETNSLHYTKAFKFSLCNNLFICLDNEKELLITEIKTFSTHKIKLAYQILDFICIYDNLYCISNNNFFIINMKTLTSITYLQTNEKLKGISYSNNLSNIFISSETTIYIFNIENNQVINEIEPKEYLYAIQAIDNILFGITINGYLDYFDIYTGSFIKRDIIPRVYENLNIKNTTGLSKAKKEVLASLGSII